MTVYERFEQVIAFALSLTVAVVVVIAFYQLLRQVVPLVVGGAIDPLNHTVFQALFGAIMTLLIAMEFKHSIIRAALREDNVIQVKTVILISLLALSRKFIILDPAEMGAATVAALAGVTLVLGSCTGCCAIWTSPVCGASRGSGMRRLNLQSPARPPASLLRGKEITAWIVEVLRRGRNANTWPVSRGCQRSPKAAVQETAAQRTVPGRPRNKVTAVRSQDQRLGDGGPDRNRTWPRDWNYRRNVAQWRGIVRPRIDRHYGVYQD